jgi:hypothetical protein
MRGQVFKKIRQQLVGILKLIGDSLVGPETVHMKEKQIKHLVH